MSERLEDELLVI